MFRILQMYENVRGPITGQMFLHVCGKMPDRFADVTGMIARTCQSRKPHVNGANKLV